MTHLDLKPSHKPIKAYYETLAEFKKHGATKETSVRAAFADLLKHCARQFKGPEGKWALIEEYSYTLASGTRGAIDGAILTDLSIVVGYWEAKDLGDNLPVEVKKKFKAGYPQSNILFQTPERAILYQDKALVGEYDLTEPAHLIKCLQDFFGSNIESEIEWEEAVQSFKERIKDFGNDLEKLIETERKESKRFQESFTGFAELCRQSINPNLSDKAVEEMLIQHLLTRRIFDSVFAQGEFLQRNPVGQEIEKVVHALTSRNFNSAEFFLPLEHYYARLEQKARSITDWHEKQQFLNTVYEKFFQGFSVKVADTHGIVYTPQPIVDFMVRSVQHILKTEFGRTLASEGVHILDPFVGTGNFIMRIMREIAQTQKSALPRKYKSELHCNEVMLLPYYIASMNIEHEYLRQVGAKKYETFEGICLVDTFELAEPERQYAFEFMTPENTQRVEKQKKAPIFVVIGNPPYNAGQLNENDNNKNRKYKRMDERVAETYAKDSSATLKHGLADPYVKAFRFASDRILANREGVVAFISNYSFVHEIAFDGMRKNLVQDFDKIYVLDLGGNVRKNPKLSGTTHNVFGIQIGVSINILIKRPTPRAQGAEVLYHKTDEFWKKEEKYHFLNSSNDVSSIAWTQLGIDNKGNWLNDDQINDFEVLTQLVPKGQNAHDSIFELYSNGIMTGRDSWVYNDSILALESSVRKFSSSYNYQLSEFSGMMPRPKIEDIIDNDPKRISWSETLKNQFKRERAIKFDSQKIRKAMYRPFCERPLYFDELLIDRRLQFPRIFPSDLAEKENKVISVVAAGNTLPFHCLISKRLCDRHFTGDSQCFPFYTYDEDGSNRKENITDWALGEFQAAVKTLPQPLPLLREGSKKNIPLPQQREGLGEGVSEQHDLTKWDIFYYVYGLLHHPGYRTKYAANLRRELPRIPLPKDAEMFWALSDAGKKLADLHVNYEQAKEYDLKEKWDDSMELRVEKMKLKKTPPPATGGSRRGLGGGPLEATDKPAGKKASQDTTPQPPPLSGAGERELIYNDHLTLTGIPPEAFEYRLGNRSAIDWIIDQYQVSTDKRSGITNDPNRADDETYILRLIKKVVTVSVETVKIVNEIANVDIE